MLQLHTFPTDALPILMPVPACFHDGRQQNTALGWYLRKGCEREPERSSSSYRCSSVASRRLRQCVSGTRHQPRSPNGEDRKSTRLNSSHLGISYAVFC